MPYKKLYRLCQDTNADHQPLQWYLDDVLNLSWVAGVDVKATNAFPVDGLRGFIIRHSPELHGLRHKYTIVVCDGMDSEMERFVVIKELMHCYFDPTNGCSTDSRIAFDVHMRQFFGQSASQPSLHVQAEFQALWMAMGVLCSETKRLEYMEQVRRGDVSIPELVNRLKAPAHIIRRFLSVQYEDEIRDILN